MREFFQDFESGYNNKNLERKQAVESALNNSNLEEVEKNELKQVLNDYKEFFSEKPRKMLGYKAKLCVKEVDRFIKKEAVYSSLEERSSRERNFKNDRRRHYRKFQ